MFNGHQSENYRFANRVSKVYIRSCSGSPKRLSLHAFFFNLFMKQSHLLLYDPESVFVSLNLRCQTCFLGYSARPIRDFFTCSLFYSVTNQIAFYQFSVEKKIDSKICLSFSDSNRISEINSDSKEIHIGIKNR